MQLNKFIVGISFILFCSLGQSQTFLLDSNLRISYDFVNWERNRFDFYGESPAFNKFYNKLDSVYNGTSKEQINIFHIGGSHLQAGTYAHRVRRYLTQMNDSMKAERGVVFPYTLAHTNNPWNYRIEYTGEWEGARNSVMKDEGIWGMEGINASTSDSVATVKLDIRRNNAYRFEYDRFRVFHNTWDSAYKVLPVDSASIIEIIENDSLNYTEFVLPERTESFEFKVARMNDDANEKFIILGIDLKNDDPGVTYHTIGVNGSSFKSYRRCELFEFQLKQYPPDMFIISVGTNDTYTKDFDKSLYEEYYDDFLKMIWRANPDAAVVLTVPNDSYYRKRYANPFTKDAADVIIKLAKKYDMAVWNFYEIMGGKGSSQRWYRNKLMPSDRIHFSGKGYDLKADLFTKALFDSWDSIIGRDSGYLVQKHLWEKYDVAQWKDVNQRIKEGRVVKPEPEYKAPVADGKAVYHTVNSGETLGHIANRYGVSVNSIMYWNDLSSTTIYPGQTFKIYGKAAPKPKKTDNTSKPKPKETKTYSGKYYYYTIKSGDTLWDIAVAHNTSVERIQALNNGLEPRDLKVGDKIKLDK